LPGGTASETCVCGREAWMFAGFIELSETGRDGRDDTKPWDYRSSGRRWALVDGAGSSSGGIFGS